MKQGVACHGLTRIFTDCFDADFADFADFICRKKAQKFRPVMCTQRGLCSKYDLSARPAFRPQRRIHRRSAGLPMLAETIE